MIWPNSDNYEGREGGICQYLIFLMKKKNEFHSKQRVAMSVKRNASSRNGIELIVALHSYGPYSSQKGAKHDPVGVVPYSRAMQ